MENFLTGLKTINPIELLRWLLCVIWSRSHCSVTLNCLTVKMKVLPSSETSVNTVQSIQHNTPEDLNLQLNSYYTQKYTSYYPKFWMEERAFRYGRLLETCWKEVFWVLPINCRLSPRYGRKANGTSPLKTGMLRNCVGQLLAFGRCRTERSWRRGPPCTWGDGEFCMTWILKNK